MGIMMGMDFLEHRNLGGVIKVYNTQRVRIKDCIESGNLEINRVIQNLIPMFRGIILSLFFFFLLPSFEWLGLFLQLSIWSRVGDALNRRGSALCIAPMAGSFSQDVDDKTSPPIFRVGGRVMIRVGDYAQFYGQASRSRWVFVMNWIQRQSKNAKRRPTGGWLSIEILSLTEI